MSSVAQRRLRLSAGTELSYLAAGDPSCPALLLLHGFPNSSYGFRDVIPALARVAYVIAPDLPGFGQSDALPKPSFAAFGEAIAELLGHLEIKERFIYLHDFGAPVGLHIAMRSPDHVTGLVIQNANAHETGLGPEWKDTRAFWSSPTAANEAKATAHLTFEGTRDQYIAGVPDDVAFRIKGEPWVEDWRVMNLPGHMETQRALIADYANHVASFDAIAAYLSAKQAPALMLWGRHDVFFNIAETLSWLQALPRMEAHVFDAGHLMLETHAAQARALIADFIAQT